MGMWRWHRLDNIRPLLLDVVRFIANAFERSTGRYVVYPESLFITP
jgi:hypothetical protein